MTKRPALTDKMKLACLIYRHEITCGICEEQLSLNDTIEWDHLHEISDGGEHSIFNLRPTHEACHQRKTTKAVKQRAHIKRLARGKVPSKHPMKSAKRKWPKRAFK